MNKIDHTYTFVLLIGASEFPDDPTIIGIPNVKANIQLLKESFIDKFVLGIPEENILVSLNEERKQIERKLRDIAERTKRKNSTLIVYYSGHGIFSSKKYQLYLTTIESTKRYLEIDSINIENFKGYIRESYAGRKILILDCCHSGAVIGSMNNTQSAIQSGIKAVEGTYIITSAAEDMPSLYPVDSPALPTYFTGKFLEIIKDGMDIEQEYCSLRDIFQQIEFEFQEADLPPPQQSNFNNADLLYFSLNKKFIEGRVTKVKRSSNLKRAIFSELALSKFFFITFSLSILLSSLYMTYDQDYGFDSNFFFNLDSVASFLILSCGLFFVSFRFIVKRHNILIAKLYALIAYFLPAVFCFAFGEVADSIGFDFFDSDGSITWKTFIFIPILLIFLYPLKRGTKEEDTFKPLLFPFVISLLICFAYFFIFGFGSWSSYTIYLGNSITLIFPFLLSGLLLNFFRKRGSAKINIIISCVPFIYPIYFVEALIRQSYASIPSFFTFYNLRLYLVYSIIPIILIVSFNYFYRQSNSLRLIKLITNSFNLNKKQL